MGPRKSKYQNGYFSGISLVCSLGRGDFRGNKVFVFIKSWFLKKSLFIFNSVPRLLLERLWLHQRRRSLHLCQGDHSSKKKRFSFKMHSKTHLFCKHVCLLCPNCNSQDCADCPDQGTTAAQGTTADQGTTTAAWFWGNKPLLSSLYRLSFLWTFSHFKTFCHICQLSTIH